MAHAPTTRLREVQSLPAAGAALLAAACRMGLEGIVSKRRDSRYDAGRPDTWVKSKCRLEQEFVVGGWTQEPAHAFKGVMLGVYEGEFLRYVGTVERGFSTTPGLAKAVQAKAAKASPFALETPCKARDVNWARPELVVNAAFQEWTASGKIRHASLTGLRDDKDPREVVRERPETNVL